jgi:hypothetical protein
MMILSDDGRTTSLTDFLFPAPAPRRPVQIVLWWERRRLFYNVGVGAAGLISLGVLALGGSVIGGTVFVPPWQPVAVFAVLANACYLLGPCVEILVHELWGRSVLPVGPGLYRMGLTFSVGLALLPSLLAILFGVASVIFNLLG